MKISIRALAIGIAMALMSYMPAHAGANLNKVLGSRCWTVCTITNNGGGDVAVFGRAAQEVLSEGKQLVIDGFCASACVVMADIARANTCLTSEAKIAVHKASRYSRDIVLNDNGEQVVQDTFKDRVDPPQSPDINRWVKAHGGYPTKGVLFMPLSAAYQFWPKCS